MSESISRRLSALSPEQLEKLRAKYHRQSQQSEITPREQVSNLPEGVRSQFQGQDVWRATSTQARLWFLEQYLGPNSLHNIVRTLRLHGKLDIAALNTALQQIVQRHEALRTTFHEIAGVPYQVIRPDPTFKLEFVDLQTLPDTEREAEFQRQLREWGQHPFDLTQDCLLRVVLFQFTEAQYALQIAVHHIVGDGWSLGILSQELSALYSALITKQEPLLPPLPLQFADYSLWLQTQLQQSVQESHRRYWQQQLSGELPVLDLPGDRPRPQVQTYRGQQIAVVFETDVVKGLKTLANQASASLFMSLLTSLNVLLYRYSHQTDIIVGTPIANRNRPELEKIFGYFVDNLPLRTDLSGNPSFLTLLQRVRQTALDAYSHAYPFAEILQLIPTIRETNRSPLFSVMVSLQNTPEADLALPGLLLSSCNADDQTLVSSAPLSSYQFSHDSQGARFDLMILLKEEHGKVAGLIEYNQDLFNATTIHRLIGHWQTLLQGILTNPDCVIENLPLLTEAECHQLLVEWNQTQADYPQDQCIHHLFEAQVEQTPDAVAVVFEDRQLTYRQLNEQANQLAHYLQMLGVKPESLVGLAFERSIEMLVGLLGVLKAGGAYVPLDLEYPHERLKFLIADTQLSLVLTHKAARQVFSDCSAHVVNIEASASVITSQRRENPCSRIGADHLAYVVHTSGSTGQPKGVLIQHRSVVNLLNAIRQQPGLTAQDTVLAVTTLAFDISVAELFLPLIVGARLLLVSREVASDGTQLLQKLNDSGTTFMQPTPATWQLLLNAGWQGNPNLKMVSTGEALPRPLAHQLLARGQDLWNLYGPTETTIWSSGCRITADSATGTIGRPIANTQFYIVDAHLQLVPVGVPGELLIGGIGLARGYLNRPELTATKFIAHPFSTEPEARLYRTGDLARWLPSGEVEYLGRLDDQVKIRGYRIELGEVEAALLQHPQVQQCVVVARADATGDQRLVAYTVASSEKAPTSSELRGALQKTLPAFMVPAAFVFLVSLPLTPSGKVNRRALPDPTTEDLPSTTYLAPRTALEQQLADIWAEVLMLERVGINDNFFELGGHSLRATQVVARLRTVFELEIPLHTLFEAPTIELLGQQIQIIHYFQKDTFTSENGFGEEEWEL